MVPPPLEGAVLPADTGAFATWAIAHSSRLPRPSSLFRPASNQMFRVVAILAAIVGAAAFAPVSRVARSSAIKMSYEGEIGVTKVPCSQHVATTPARVTDPPRPVPPPSLQPAGFFDPLGLAKNIDEDTFAKVTALPPCVSTPHPVTHASFRTDTTPAPPSSLLPPP